MALDLAPMHIRVNSISPDWIWTPEVNKAAEEDGGGRAKWEPIWGDYHMLQRCGEPVEVAAAALFLLSDDASFVTAADLAVDVFPAPSLGALDVEYLLRELAALHASLPLQ